MVLPPPAPDAGPAPPGSGWLEGIQLGLSLSQGGILLLVEQAHDARLGEAVRAILPQRRGLQVLTDVRALRSLPSGSTALLLPRAEDADWLNLNRPLISQRSLKIVLWASREITDAIARRAPDFYDWISDVATCPPRSPGFAVASLRAAASAPGVAWVGGDLDVCWAEAFPGAERVSFRADLSFEKLVASLGGLPEGAWAIWEGITDDYLLNRARWACAAAGRRSRNLALSPGAEIPGWWKISGEGVSPRALAVPGHLAALLDFEPDALALSTDASADPGLIDVLLAAGDGGAALARRLFATDSLAAESVAGPAASLPALRALSDHPGVLAARARRIERISRGLHRGAKLAAPEWMWWAAQVDDLVPPNRLREIHERPWALEALLRSPDPRGLDLAEPLALKLGVGDVADWIRARANEPPPRWRYHPAANAGFVVPYPAKGDRFVGRQEALDRVRAQLVQGRPTAIGQTAAFVGLGGIGKTQLAAEYAHTWRDHYPGGVYWFHADQNLDGQLILIGEQAGWSARDIDHATKLDVATRRVKEGVGTLLIFDNVIRAADIERLLPAPDTHAHILLTSREPQPGFWQVDVDLLDEAGSLRLLTDESERPLETEADRAAARRIHEQLEGLPLALELAGAYLRRYPVGWSEYADMLARSGAEARGLRPPGFVRESLTRHEANLLATLRLDAPAIHDAPGLDDALDALAWSGPASMSWSLLSAMLQPEDPDALRESLALAVNMRVLRREESARGPRYRMHRLVRQVRRVLRPVVERLEFAEVLVARLGDWFEEMRWRYDDLPFFEAELPHLDAWLERAVFVGWGSVEVRLRWLLAYPDYHRGRYQASLRLVETAWERLEVLGLDAVELRADLLVDQGSLREKMGSIEEAAKLTKRALSLYEESVSRETLKYAVAKQYMSFCCRELDLPEEALSHAEEAVCVVEERLVLGGRWLAIMYMEYGLARVGVEKDRKGLDFLRRSLSLMLGVEAEDSFDVGMAHNRLSLGLSALGYYDEALVHSKLGLKNLLGRLGEDHLFVANAYANVGYDHLRLLNWNSAKRNLHKAANLYRKLPGMGSRYQNLMTDLGELERHAAQNSRPKRKKKPKRKRRR